MLKQTVLAASLTILLAPAAAAAPLLLSKSQLVATTFCREYRCQHVSTRTHDPALSGPGVTTSEFRLPAFPNVSLRFVRKDGVLTGVLVNWKAARDPDPRDYAFVPALERALTGVAVGYDLLGNCGTPTDEVISSGRAQLVRLDRMTVRVGCLRAEIPFGANAVAADYPTITLALSLESR